LVKWEGYTTEESTWQTKEDLVHASEILEEYLRKKQITDQSVVSQSSSSSETSINHQPIHKNDNKIEVLPQIYINWNTMWGDFGYIPAVISHHYTKAFQQSVQETILQSKHELWKEYWKKYIEIIKKHPGKFTALPPSSPFLSPSSSPFNSMGQQSYSQHTTAHIYEEARNKTIKEKGLGKQKKKGTQTQITNFFIRT
jgi:hypothetical protein